MDGKNEYWVQATEAEALLLLGSVKDSVVSYVEAVSLPDANHLGYLARGSRHYRLQGNMKMIKFLNKSKTAFPTLGIVAFSGHVLDQPGSDPRFPPEAEGTAKNEIVKALEDMNASCGYSSAACGTDIIFLESMIERGAETHIFLPFAKKDFIEISVRRAGGNWVSRFERVLDLATSIHYVTKRGLLWRKCPFFFCNNILLGFAAMRGRGMDEDPKLLGFLGWEARGKGRTGEIVKEWRKYFQ